jgi:hypothetical protein
MTGDVTAESIVLAVFLAFCRIGACFMLMPGLASIRVPMQVRLYIAVAVSAALLAHLWDAIIPHVNNDASRLFTLIGSEVLIGAMIGLVARFYLLAAQFIASAVAMVSGFNAMAGVAIDSVPAEGIRVTQSRAGAPRQSARVGTPSGQGVNRDCVAVLRPCSVGMRSLLGRSARMRPLLLELSLTVPVR